MHSCPLLSLFWRFAFFSPCWLFPTGKGTENEHTALCSMGNEKKKKVEHLQHYSSHILFRSHSLLHPTAKQALLAHALISPSLSNGSSYKLDSPQGRGTPIDFDGLSFPSMNQVNERFSFLLSPSPQRHSPPSPFFPSHPP